ncbi:MAG: type I-C CRISPR-associated protein Cas8c/Csd1 [Rhodobacterales bacterium]|nr:type I-C CRISPR-associated protein Cas8c/Csd1 [Rhodobacterales bacterium]MDX5501586.1 type I-C CRISPR-associated protein Cas8c/Csd1 [Rhodobacterales bacterium]
MSLLAALARAYDRLPDRPPYGFSSEKIGFCVVLNPDGSIASVEDLRDTDKKRSPMPMLVPTSFKRPGVTPRPFFLWDNANFALGLGAMHDPADRRFEVFRAKHLEFLADEEDAEIIAFRGFLEHWSPARIPEVFPVEDLSNAKIVFAMRDSYRHHYLHQSDVSQRIWSQRQADWLAVEGKAAETAICLVTGERLPIARTHLAIKGIPSKSGKDADTLIGFNLDAFTSYGHEQGDNAPVSEVATFQYTAALNRFLERDSGHRVQIGDTSTVFWADGSGAMPELAESLFAAFVDSPEVDFDADRMATNIVAAHLERIRRGDRLADIEPRIAEGVRFQVLGLAPNAARLSVRFYWEDDFGQLTRNYQQYLSETRIDPPPRDGFPPIWRYLVELAVLNKRENVPPNLAGEWMRAILTGGTYPMSLLATVLMRLRADGDVNALRAAILKSVLIRNFKKETIPVALDPDYKDSKGYLLGRLFAAYEQVQRAALGANVNATIKDKFYGAASASPQKVFATLNSGAQDHFGKLRKANPGWAYNLEQLIMSIMDQMSPGDDPIPAYLSAPEQALFGLGYYHQRSEFFRKRDEKTDDTAPETAK